MFPSQAAQAANNMGYLGTENTAVSMDFVNNHKPQLGEKFMPLKMIRQNTQM